MKKHKIFFNNQMVELDNTIEIHSPETNQIVGILPAFKKDQINIIFENADKAFNAWSMTSQQKRIDYIMAFGKIMLANKEELAKAIVDEVAKNYTDAIKEVERSYDYIIETIEEYNKNFIKPKIQYDNPVTRKGKVSYQKRVPLGVVLAISPFNYPVNLSISKIIPALVLGNTVVFKPATQGSISGALLSKYFYEANLPANVFNVVIGKGSEIGDELIENKKIKMISFTGGVAIGTNIAQKKSGIPLVLEMGGKDPAIVLKDANIDSAIKNIVKGSLSYSGQRCTAIKIVFIDKEIASKFTSKLVEEVKKLKVGSSFDESDITALINPSAVKWAEKLIKDAIDKGAKLELGGNTLNNILYPTVLSNVKREMLIYDQEQFAPIIPIVEFDNIQTVINDLDKSLYGLQACIFTNSEKDFIRIANRLDCGSINWNLPSSRGPDKFPFIGVKNSGFGTQGIYWALESMSRIKSLVIEK
ncbi:MAG: aldehyde dehydrogenase family protein [Mycoplasmoidaceae bacterium]